MNRLILPTFILAYSRIIPLATTILLAGSLPTSDASDHVVPSDHVVVVLDNSSSMRNKLRSNRRVVKMDAAKDALIQVLQALPDKTQVGVLTLHDGKEWAVPLGSADPAIMESAVRKIKTHRGTPLGKYIKRAADALLELRESQRYGSFRLLIVTDGEANDRAKVEKYLPDILARGITVDVIGVDMKSDHSLATKAHSYRRANDTASLSKALAEVLAESVGANPSDADDYELLQGIPDELALAMVRALGPVRNHPIGEPEPTPAQVSDETVVALQSDRGNVPSRTNEAVAVQNAGVDAQPHGNDVSDSSRNTWLGWGSILIVIIGAGIVSVVLVVFVLVSR